MDLKTARFFKRMTQYDLERETGVSQTKISAFERGYRRLKEDEQRRIERALNLEGWIDWEDDSR